MVRSKVWLVNEGGWGDLSAEKGDYDVIVMSIKEALEDPNLRKETAVVEVVYILDHVLPQVVAAEDEAVLVFMTRGMLRRAQTIVREHPNLRVVVLTGAPDQTGMIEGVLVLDKMDITSYVDIPDIILGEEVPSDWTVDPATGRSNSSPKYLELVDAVAGIIRNNAFDIVGGDLKTAAGVIMAKLVHEYHMAPQEEDPTE